MVERPYNLVRFIPTAGLNILAMEAKCHKAKEQIVFCLSFKMYTKQWLAVSPVSG